ncbi:MAG: hypothetical protein EHM68_08295 [Lysobacterales bacterium]|nr:MAG: hypothetical protein EHM68_08295 [Xanthomonadales bacterium]
MLRLTPRRNRRAPNALAILGAFLLAASLLAGAGHSLPAAVQQTNVQQAAAQQTAEANALDAATPAQPEAENPVREAAVTKTRKFRVNLFLFRH